MSNVTILAGENLYRIRADRLHWIAEFSRKYGADNITRLDGKDLTVRNLLDEVGTAPFLAAKRLVVIDMLPKFAKGDTERIDAVMHPDVVLLIVHPKGTRRPLPKDLPESWTVKQAPLLKRRGLQQWMEQESRRLGKPVDAAAMDALLDTIGEDQDMLSQELAKLAVGAFGERITRDDILRLAVPTLEGVDWRITDDVCSGKRTKALAYAHQLLERGSDPYGLWAMLLSMLKNLVLVHAALAAGRSSQDIAEQFGIHPFALRSLISYAQRCDAQKLHDCLAVTADADVALKTGGYRATDEAPEELTALIDRFLLTCP